MSSEKREEPGGGIKTLETTVAFGYDMHVSWEFEANLAELPKDGIETSTLEAVPFGGNWRFRAQVSGETASQIAFGLRYDPLPAGRLGRKVNVIITLSVYRNGRAEVLTRGAWRSQTFPDVNPITSSVYHWNCTNVAKKDFEKLAGGSASDFTSKRRYLLTAVVQQDAPPILDAIACDTVASVERPLATSLADPAFHATEKDFRICFPGARAGGLEIWTTSAFLEHASPYFATMLQSHCLESVPCPSQGAQTSSESSATELASSLDEVKVQDWDDSDDEADALVAAAEAAHAGTEAYKDVHTAHEYRQVSINEAAFSTYRAVFLYLKSGYIAFAPLRSTFTTSADDSDTAPSSRVQHLRDYSQTNPCLPLPVSPKSVYRLAHLLQLPDLQNRALKALTTSLTITGAIHELVSPTALAYDEVRKVLCAFLVKNLSDVRSTPDWKALQGKAAGGELDSAAVILVDFITALIDARDEDAPK